MISQFIVEAICPLLEKGDLVFTRDSWYRITKVIVMKWSFSGRYYDLMIIRKDRSLPIRINPSEIEDINCADTETTKLFRSLAALEKLSE
jgi:hypothetical protein